MIRLETDRLIIRDHVKEDLQTLHGLISDKEIMFYIQDIMTETIEGSQMNLQVALEENEHPDRTKYFFAVIEKSSNEYVGEIGYTKLLENSEGNVMELGYFTNKRFWGKGYVTEAAKAVVDYAFAELDTLKIETGCNAQNKGSEAVMIKLGMKREAYLKRHVLIDDIYYDRVEYGLLKEEWKDLCR
ncbi:MULTISPECIES: GNAT family N-acetyltransferase [unclassified Fusibacter]|uniref:GNAT family N-acetyltransferase n=1 Tax=unclassified Fusibacter TaxID=2624464 RepID=UPI0013E95483|nr:MULTISPECIES: GNAT family protein [unclassified Fusibacter]MCK8060646.1 GNAT family N-acetyltransferase [Fusibacter sp. A2]NPE22900.1 GNAT family N-acetyltransferase [Fusibacter sp. A1]